MRTARLALAITLLAVAAPPTFGQGWNLFGSRMKSPASSETAANPAAAELSEQSGPWLILATTFSGEGAAEQAAALARELNERLDLPTYVHQMTFDLGDDDTVGRGIDRYGAPIKMKYQSGDARREWAVLVGHYQAADDKVAERDLASIKAFRPKALEAGDDGRTTQNFAGYRSVASKLFSKGSADGPMRTAFLTRNPILPKEYFVPKGVTPFVEKMNKGLKHSALDIPDRYTVRVATFRGRNSLVGARQASGSASGSGEDDPLMKAAEHAHFLCQAMRDAGWDAYEFHDRTESYVCVGSFADFAAAGGKRVAPEILEIARTFDATTPTPVEPLAKRRGAPTSQRAEQVREAFGQRLGGTAAGQVSTDAKPKYAMISLERGKPKQPIVFDVHPQVIEAPKRSLGGRFAWRR